MEKHSEGFGKVNGLGKLQMKPGQNHISNTTINKYKLSKQWCKKAEGYICNSWIFFSYNSSQWFPTCDELSWCNEHPQPFKLLYSPVVYHCGLTQSHIDYRLLLLFTNFPSEPISFLWSIISTRSCFPLFHFRYHFIFCLIYNPIPVLYHFSWFTPFHYTLQAIERVPSENWGKRYHRITLIWFQILLCNFPLPWIRYQMRSRNYKI